MSSQRERAMKPTDLRGILRYVPMFRDHVVVIAVASSSISSNPIPPFPPGDAPPPPVVGTKASSPWRYGAVSKRLENCKCCVIVCCAWT